MSALVDGARRVWRAPWLLAGVFGLTFLLALPLALAMRGLIADDLGRSLVSASVAEGVNYDWWQEFSAKASGLGTTFTPSVIGFAAVLDNVSGLMDGRAPILPIAAALAAYLGGWIFISGGLLDRLARQRPVGAAAFFCASGGFFFRFLRLSVASGLVYALLFVSVRERLFGLYADINQDLAAERMAMVWRFGFYTLFGLLLLAVNIVFDYARIRAVVEDRRSMIGSLVAALGFIRRHARQVTGLYAANALLFVALLAAWALVAPGAGGPGPSAWFGFAAGQVYLLGRLALKLQFMASQTALFQRSLAHASYVAQPTAEWPDSPAAEAVRA
jgi:hypothetical protein